MKRERERERGNKYAQGGAKLHHHFYPTLSFPLVQCGDSAVSRNITWQKPDQSNVRLTGWSRSSLSVMPPPSHFSASDRNLPLPRQKRVKSQTRLTFASPCTHCLSPLHPPDREINRFPQMKLGKKCDQSSIESRDVEKKTSGYNGKSLFRSPSPIHLIGWDSFCRKHKIYELPGWKSESEKSFHLTDTYLDGCSGSSSLF